MTAQIGLEPRRVQRRQFATELLLEGGPLRVVSDDVLSEQRQRLVLDGRLQGCQLVGGHHHQRLFIKRRVKPRGVVIERRVDRFTRLHRHHRLPCAVDGR